MSITEKREHLHNYINHIDDRFLNALYAMIQSYLGVTPTEYKLTDKQKAELDRRIEHHRKGESKSYSWDDVKQRVHSKS